MDSIPDMPAERDTVNRVYCYENRIRFYILVIGLCALSALFIELTAQQAERLESYTQRQLEAVTATQPWSAPLNKTTVKRESR